MLRFIQLESWTGCFIVPYNGETSRAQVINAVSVKFRRKTCNTVATIHRTSHWGVKIMLKVRFERIKSRGKDVYSQDWQQTQQPPEREVLYGQNKCTENEWQNTAGLWHTHKALEIIHKLTDWTDCPSEEEKILFDSYRKEPNKANNIQYSKHVVKTDPRRTTESTFLFTATFYEKVR